MRLILIFLFLSGNENALFLRLHLLQSIVLYHQNKFNEAEKLIAKVEQELKYLKVDDIQLSQLMELGENRKREKNSRAHKIELDI